MSSFVFIVVATEFFMVLGIKPRVLCMVSTWCTTDLYLQSLIFKATTLKTQMMLRSQLAN
jgi:hypothetical protein